jgi:hypothetical protein
MATKAPPEDKATAAVAEDSASASKTKATKKVIKGNLPYTQAPGVFKKTLEGIITAGQPERFTSNFMDTVLVCQAARHDLCPRYSRRWAS